MSKKPGKDQPQAPEERDSAGDQPKLTRGERRAQEAKRQFHARRHRVLLITVAASLVINAALAYWLYDSMVVKKQERRVTEAAQEVASDAAANVEQLLIEKSRQLDQWAAHPPLVEAMRSGETDKLGPMVDAMAAGQSDLLALRAYPAGTADVLRDHPAPVRYAEIDLLRRATRRQDTLPEAAPIGDSWQLHIASPVPPKGEGNAAGSLLATYDSAEFVARATGASPQLGTLVLQQSFSSHRPYALHQHGQGDAAPAATAEVPNSYLSVQFTPSAVLVDRSAELPGMWILTISLSVVAGLVLSLLVARVVVRPRQGPGGEGLTLPQQYKDARSGETAEPEEEQSDNTPQPSTLYQKQDILDIEVVEEDADILGLDSAEPRRKAPPPKPDEAASGKTIPTDLFRAYDIRGKVGDGLNARLAEQIGLALGSEVQDQGENAILVARDDRTHSPELCQALIDGLLASGCDVINIGVVPTPLLNFATLEHEITSSGVMVTASHNGAEYNGFKIIINGETLADGAIQDIRSRIVGDNFLEGDGKETREDIVPDYIDRIFSDVALAGQVSLVIDAGNAVSGAVAPQLFEELGCEVTPLYCDLDGTFPNHNPDPSVAANLQDLIAKVKETDADLGVAFDGDGDRLAVVTPAGHIIWPDQLLMLFAKDVLSRNPGADVLFDVKCSKQLNQLISSYGGRPIMWKTGHSHMKRKMQETGALIGGEYSGHIFIKERWYGFDDGLYAAARLLEIITLRDQPIDEVFSAFPMLPATPEIRIAVPEKDKFALVEKLIENGEFQNGKLTTIDGLRVDFAKGWGLVRASNTAAEITLRFEAESEQTLEKLKQLFKRELLKIDKSLKLEF